MTIDVYAVTKCPAKPHCLLAATPIPASDLVLLSSAAALKGSLTFVVGDGESQGDGWLTGSGGTTLYVDAVVVRASSASGKSPFVIAWTWQAGGPLAAGRPPRVAELHAAGGRGASSSGRRRSRR
ncbi:MAG: hypothetical protein ABSA21_08850 [Candidatus Limnocylindrales bacterium]